MMGVVASQAGLHRPGLPARGGLCTLPLDGLAAEAPRTACRQPLHSHGNAETSLRSPCGRKMLHTGRVQAPSAEGARGRAHRCHSQSGQQLAALFSRGQPTRPLQLWGQDAPVNGAAGQELFAVGAVVAAPDHEAGGVRLLPDLDAGRAPVLAGGGPTLGSPLLLPQQRTEPGCCCVDGLYNLLRSCWGPMSARFVLEVWVTARQTLPSPGPGRADPDRGEVRRELAPHACSDAGAGAEAASALAVGWLARTHPDAKLMPACCVAGGNVAALHAHCTLHVLVAARQAKLNGKHRVMHDMQQLWVWQPTPAVVLPVPIPGSLQNPTLLS